MPPIRPLFLTNTLTGQKERLETHEPGCLRFYSCGPTVYDFIHIGNLRGGLVADLFYRYFERVGYQVTYVRNYTDIEDKIIQRSQKEGLAWEDLTHRFIQEVEKDYALVGMKDPTHKTCATTHVTEMIELIEKLIQQGKAYVASSGEVFYSIQTFENYGQLSRKKKDDLISGVRVEVNAQKRSSFDFTLWKPAQPNEPFWESPWGRGRPGWHIECSAMASRWLGDQIDVHHGGEDLIFPHHENEIAQSEGASGKSPFVRYWLHHAFLTFSQEKMSKSLGNVLTARELISTYGGEVVRFFLLSIHYRSPMEFSLARLEQAIQALQRIYEAKQKAYQIQGKGGPLAISPQRLRSSPLAESAWGQFLALCERTQEQMDEAYAQDFNTPGVLGALFSLIREWNRLFIEVPLAEATPSCLLGAQKLVQILEEDLGGVFGVGRLAPDSILTQLAQLRSQLRGDQEGLLPESEIQKALLERAAARKNKDFLRSDQIRKQLEERGVLILDGSEGTTWRYV